MSKKDATVKGSIFDSLESDTNSLITLARNSNMSKVAYSSKGSEEAEKFKEEIKKNKIMAEFVMYLADEAEDDDFAETIKDFMEIAKVSLKRNSEKEVATRLVKEILKELGISGNKEDLISKIIGEKKKNEKGEKAAFTEDKNKTDDIKFIENYIKDFGKFDKYEKGSKLYNELVDRLSAFFKAMKENITEGSTFEIVDSLWRGYYDFVLTMANGDNKTSYWLTKDKKSKENSTNQYTGDDAGNAALVSDIKAFREPKNSKKENSIAA